MSGSWREVLGRELVAKPTRRHVFASLPEEPAVYLWKRNLSVPSSAKGSPRVLFEWVRSEVARPYGLVSNLQVSHFASVGEFRLGGGDLTDEKLATLERLCASTLGRNVLVRLFDGMNDVTPALYVGEAELLPQRVWEHLDGQSDFSQRLAQHLNLDWERLVLRYFVLPPATAEEQRRTAKELRTLVEFVTTKLALGTSVSRIG